MSITFVGPPDLEAKALDLLVPGVEHLPRLEVNGRVNLVDVALKMSLRLCLFLTVKAYLFSRILQLEYLKKKAIKKQISITVPHLSLYY